MRDDNLVQQKSYAFAIRIIKLSQYLVNERHEFVLSKQVLRSGTSIGANIEEAIGGHSKKDFFAKLSIAYKETRETHYWLRLLKDTGFIDAKLAESLLKDCNELLKIIGTIRKTLQKKSEKRE